MCIMTLRTSSSCTASWSDLRRPESNSSTRWPRLSQFPNMQTSQSQHQDKESLNSSRWFPELTCQAPKVFLHPCCKHFRAIYQTIAIEGFSSTTQTRSHPYRYFQRNALHAQRTSVQKAVRAAPFSYVFLCLCKRCPLFHKHNDWFNHFVDPNNVGVQTQNLFCIYFHQWRGCILKTRRVFLSFNKNTVLGQL